MIITTVASVNEGRAADSNEKKTTANALEWDENLIKETSANLRKEMKNFFAEENFTSKIRVKVSGKFIIVHDVSDGYAEWLAALLGEVGKAFDKFIDRIGLQVLELEKPMTVFVFASREEFDAYATKLRGPAYREQANKPTGFYNQKLNRSIIYDRTGVEENLPDPMKYVNVDYKFTRKKINEHAREIKRRDNADSNTSTIVHEATHQLCYNYAIFSTDFRAPDWLVEGLAMTFEQTSQDAPLGWRFRNYFPVNYGRLNQFRDYAKRRPGCEILDEILVSDDFAVRLDDAGYAASWAMFYYCYRKRPKELAKYMAVIAQKKPFTKYEREERLQDFVDAFGEIQEFGVEFAKFIRSL